MKECLTACLAGVIRCFFAQRAPGCRLLLEAALAAWVISGCLPQPAVTRLAPETREYTGAPAELSPAPAASAPATDTPGPIPTRGVTFTAEPAPSPFPTITMTPEPYGCQKPPDDYTRLEVDGWIFNRRTYAMLQHAAELYGGELEITGYHITQGSYHDNGSASFGTHLGGGAVDLSVMRKGTYTVLWDDVDPLIYALRAAGFAAWLRSYGELFPDSPVHIHAIAIGDRELSLAAQEQLTGKFGYFRGYSGVPSPNGIPIPDRHGGPILCQWMIDLGYRDMREP